MAKKRGNGEGTLQHRKDGRWSMTFVAGHLANGKPLRKTVYAKSQQEVLEKGRKLKAELEKGIVINKRLKFSDWADQWYKDYEGSVSISTYESYGYTLRLAKTLMGTRQLHAIKASTIEQALKQLMGQGYSASQVRKVRTILNQIFRKAEANGLIDRNPVQLAERIKTAARPSTKDAFTTKEVAILFEQLPKNQTGHAIRLCIACGLRPQELLGLQKRHIAEDGNMLIIEQAVKRSKGSIYIGDPKSLAGFRNIPIPDFGKECALFLRQQADDFVMPSKNGLPINPSTWRKRYQGAITAIPGVRYLPPHCCRHTYITFLCNAGVQTETVQALAGQNDYKATMAYIHIKDDITAKAVGKLEEALKDKL